jgi:hypothetical protein
MPTLVLITGYARSGKDTFALGIELAAKRSDVAHINYADGLKESANKFLEWVGLHDGDTMDFFDDDFKAKHRNVLVELGRFARSYDRDIFAKMLCGDAAEFHTEKRREQTLRDTLVVTSDWRYLNELKVAQRSLGADGWRIVTVRINTVGIEAANDEEGISIGEITRETVADYEYTFSQGSAACVEAEGRFLARTLGL